MDVVSWQCIIHLNLSSLELQVRPALPILEHQRVQTDVQRARQTDQGIEGWLGRRSLLAANLVDVELDGIGKVSIGVQAGPSIGVQRGPLSLRLVPVAHRGSRGGAMVASPWNQGRRLRGA